MEKIFNLTIKGKEGEVAVEENKLVEMALAFCTGVSEMDDCEYKEKVCSKCCWIIE